MAMRESIARRMAVTAGEILKMSNRLSTKTKPVAFRLDNEVYDILKRRADAQGVSPSDYLKKRVTYDLTRKH